MSALDQIEITPVADGSIEIPLAPEPKGDGEGNGTKPAAPAESKPITADDITALQRELTAAKAERDAERNQRVAGERTAADTTRQLSSEVETQLYNREVTVDSSISSVEGEIAALRITAAKALEEGKWGEASAAQESLSDAKLRLREFKFQKGQLASYRAQLAERAKQPAQPTAPAGVGARTAAWIAAHPKFNSDPAYQAKAMQGHYAALAAGVAPDSDAYFQMIEQITGDRAMPTNGPNKGTNDPNSSGEGADGKPPARRGPQGEVESGVAPVTRRTTTPNPTPRPGTIRLSGDEVEAADAMFGEEGSIMYIKDKAERYKHWHASRERLKSEGRLS